MNELLFVTPVLDQRAFLALFWFRWMFRDWSEPL